MSKYELIIFDLDGTLADTSPGILNSIRYVQKIMDLPEITLEQMYSHVGPPMEESYARNFGLSDNRLTMAVNFHKEYAMQQGYREMKIYDGIPDLLTELRQKGILTAVATLKAQSTAEKIINEYLPGKFDLLVGASDECPMTKAEMIEHCVNSLSCEKPKTVLVGDSIYDAAGAAQTGIDFIAVTYGFGFRTVEEAMQSKCICSCESVGDLRTNLFT